MFFKDRGIGFSVRLCGGGAYGGFPLNRLAPWTSLLSLFLFLNCTCIPILNHIVYNTRAGLGFLYFIGMSTHVF